MYNIVIKLISFGSLRKYELFYAENIFMTYVEMLCLSLHGQTTFCKIRLTN